MIRDRRANAVWTARNLALSCTCNADHINDRLKSGGTEYDVGPAGTRVRTDKVSALPAAAEPGSVYMQVLFPRAGRRNAVITDEHPL